MYNFLDAFGRFLLISISRILREFNHKSNTIGQILDHIFAIYPMGKDNLVRSLEAFLQSPRMSEVHASLEEKYWCTSNLNW